MVTNADFFIETSSSITSPPELLEFFLRAVESEGYQNAIFAKARDRRLVSIAWAQFPRGYLDIYREREWDKIDPIVQHVHAARRPFRWDDLCARIDLTKEQQKFLRDCRELGVHSGVTVPLHGPGTEVDMISLSLRNEQPTHRDRLPQIYAISAQYWLRFGQLNDAPAKPMPHLTARELECLRWCKEGKTNWEIGEIISTSEKTVEFHLSNAIKKLGACNRITAVVMAIQSGSLAL
jgi:DNA-binding CsgD family transcriptional regulator